MIQTLTYTVAAAVAISEAVRTLTLHLIVHKIEKQNSKQ